jgi:hypothetical protein
LIGICLASNNALQPYTADDALYTHACSKKDDSNIYKEDEDEKFEIKLILNKLVCLNLEQTKEIEPHMQS